MLSIKIFFRRLFRGFIFAICLCCVCAAAFYSYGQMKEYNSLRDIEDEIAARIDVEKEAQQKLELELEYNMTDAYVEKVARERLGLVKSTDIKFENENK